MKVVEGIMATNEVTRKQDIMADSALEDALEQLKTRGNPLLISHDWHRLTGWVQGGTLVNDGDILKLVGYSLLPETDEEEQYIVAQTDGLLQQRFEFFLSEAHQQLSQIKGLSEAAKLLLTNGTNCLAIFQPNIAEQLAPNIFGLQDVDGLIPLSELKLDLRSMTFRHKDVVLFPHKCFRRSMSRLNNVNADFLTYLYRLQHKTHIDIRIRLDSDLVSVPNGVYPFAEYDFWWGPKFDDDVRRIKSGVTVHKNSATAEYCHGLDKTEFFWYPRDGLRVFQAEEILKTPNLLDETDDTSLYGQRYVHSIINETDGHIQHLDGAVRIYDQDMYSTRVVSPINKFRQSTHYEKLWRTDHAIEINTWKALIHLYFRNNETIIEYFGYTPDIE